MPAWGFAFRRERGAGFNRDVFEGAVLLILIERGGGGIVGDVDVGPAVVIEIGRGDTQTIGAWRFPDAGFLADVGERAVAIVVVQDVLAAAQAGRSAGDQQALVGAGAGFGRRGGLQIEIDIVGDEEIEMAVAIVIHKSAAGVPADFGAGLR